jgi:hypothetical protein
MFQPKTSKDINLVFSTEKINEILRKEDLGIKRTRDEHIWLNNIHGVRKSNLKFGFTQEEIQEYAKCKLDVQYFAEKYCMVKREDGTVGNIKLRDYQKDIIDLYDKSKYSILMASRQTGKCISLITSVLVKDSITGLEYYITMGELYYSYIKKFRRLNILERVKYYFYKILSKL